MIIYNYGGIKTNMMFCSMKENMMRVLQNIV